MQTESQAYEYTRQDGTVEFAANREEALEMCPVLGKLAMEDPETASLLLDMASMGGAKMAEKTGQPKPETSEQKAPEQKEAAESVEPIMPIEHVEHVGLRPDSQNYVIRNEPTIDAEIIQARMPTQEEVIVPGSTGKPQKSVGTVPDRIERVASEVAKPMAVLPARETERTVTVEEVVVPFTGSQPATGQIRMELTTAETADAITSDDSVVMKPRQPDIKPTEELSDRTETAPVVVKISVEKKAAEPAESAVGPPSVVTLAEPLANEGEPEYVDRADELDAEPSQIYRVYEDFSDALRSLIDLPSERAEEAPKEGPALDNLHEPARTASDEILEAPALPAIAMTVAERLSEIEDEEKEAAALFITDMMEIIQTTEVLVAEEAESEVIDTLRAELEEHVVELFEQLGIEYETEDITKFITVLFRSDFQPPQAKITELDLVDLERDGTHEAKRHFPQIADGLTSVEDKLQKLLGELTLFYALPGTRAVWPRLKSA